LKFSLQWAQALRKENINTEIYAEPSKLKKQLGYADNKKIPFVAIVGENEMQEGKITFKNMATGEQQMISLEELIQRLKN
jgi:histidyl-tRNA synthetase